MVMIDAQTAKGGRAGTTFHEAGGRGGCARGATGALCDQWLYGTVPCVINAADFRGEL